MAMRKLLTLIHMWGWYVAYDVRRCTEGLFASAVFLLLAWLLFLLLWR